MRRSQQILTALTLSCAVLTAAGCASVSPAAQVVSTMSAPEPVPGYDWFYHVDANLASLAYGLKDSDDLRLGLECRRGTGSLELSAVAASGVREIHLESGGDTERFTAKGEPSELHDGDFLTASSKADVPVFKRFRSLGWLAQWRDDQSETYAAHAASISDIEGFFAFCG